MARSGSRLLPNKAVNGDGPQAARALPLRYAALAITWHSSPDPRRVRHYE